MASLVNSVEKTCQPGEIAMNICEAWCRYGASFVKNSKC